MSIEILDIIQKSMHVVWKYEYYLTHANMAKYLYVSEVRFITVLVNIMVMYVLYADRVVSTGKGCKIHYGCEHT
jgi:hypothetical protein